MKGYAILCCLVVFAQTLMASEVIPPRIAVKWLIQAIQEGRTNNIGYYFDFDAKKHGILTPLSREEQLKILNDIPRDKIKFDKDEYAIEQGKQFVVKMTAPLELEFEMEHVNLQGEKGPPWKYQVIAIRRTAQPTAAPLPRDPQMGHSEGGH